LVNIKQVQDDVLKLLSAVKALPEISSDQKNCIKSLYKGMVSYPSIPTPILVPPAAPVHPSSSFDHKLLVSLQSALSSNGIPLLHLKRNVGNTWEYSSNVTGIYLNILLEIATSGMTFEDKNPLLTGVGKGSIGVNLVIKGFLYIFIISHSTPFNVMFLRNPRPWQWL
jgi:fatty acid synthase subunit alpha, fungi type